MQAPEDTPARAPADLARLRIHRGDASASVGGFPWIRLFLAFAGLLLLVIFQAPLLGLFGGAGGAVVETGRAVKVVPGQAAEGEVSANGYIVADKQASLSTVISGRLVELHAAEGDAVKSGQVVARIQYDDLEAQERQALAQVTAAGARLEEARALTTGADARVAEAAAEVKAAELSSARLAAELAAQERMTVEAREGAERLEREVVRNRPLFEQRLIDAGEWDRIQTAARMGAQSREAAEARERATRAALAAWAGQIDRRRKSLAVAEAAATAARKSEAVASAARAVAGEAVRFAAIQVEKTRIRASFDGVVIRKDAEEGEVIAPMGAGNSRGSVLTIVDPGSFEVQVELSERRIARVSEADRAVVFLEAVPDRGLPGRVRKIWPRADRSKGSIEVRVALDERPPILRPDMAVRVVFKGSAETTIEPGAAFVTVPRAAVVRRAGKDVVFVVSGGTVRRREVQRGERRGSDVVVVGGLDGGEKVVLDPSADLADGDPVSEES
jgi:RND family efflux transporter MFP subunit